MKYISEKYQLGILAEYLTNNDFQFVREGRLYGIPIDVIGKKEDYVYTFELKTKDFKRGITQASRNLDFADRSYLVVWEHRLSDSLISRIDDSGVGLISVNENVCIEVEAPPNSPNKFARTEANHTIEENV